MIAYMYPMLCVCNYLNIYENIITHFDTPYSCWIFLEAQLFACWVIASILFLLLTYLCDYRSHWQEHQLLHKRNIWGEKDIDDYMHFLRNEYKVFALVMSFNIVDYFFIGYIFKYNSESGEIDPRFAVGDLVQMGAN
jgi:hypothetical protein